MSPAPSYKSLLALLQRKRLAEVVNQLLEGFTTFEDCKNRSEGQWKEFYGLAGVDVFNHLNPTSNAVTTPVRINEFLSNTLADIENDFTKPSTTGTKRSHPKTPTFVGRWVEFMSDAARYEYPTTPIGKDVALPATTEFKFQLEKDIDKVVACHLDNFNRIFRDQGKEYRFSSKATVFPSTSETANLMENLLKFFGVPDNVLTLGSKVLSFVEDKTPNDLAFRHSRNGRLFDLLEIYEEDIKYQETERVREDVGRMDVRTVFDQVYGYLSLNNLIYGCVTCYDATYFLWRPKKSTLLISHPIFNNSRSPTDRKSTRLNSSHQHRSRMPSSA